MFDLETLYSGIRFQLPIFLPCLRLPGTSTPGVPEKKVTNFQGFVLGSGEARLRENSQRDSSSRRSICVQIVFKRLDDVSREIDNNRFSSSSDSRAMWCVTWKAIQFTFDEV